MDKNQIIIISALLAVVGIKIYQKYIKKDKTKSGTETKSSSSMPFSSGSKEEDYEPYSKK